eukprot:TRINITY_DN387_c0_g1_i1.p1 TRINITY_DN387_c0_g1~~TRINITY_DN387_c0_g1_i1.p1  ORF type:complete len:171 (-),score=47.06 TRINITY_DN387_c0_g1_i1:77-589(-)
MALRLALRKTFSSLKSVTRQEGSSQGGVVPRGGFGVNKVIIVGNLGREPEIKQFENNTVATFPLATNEYWTDKEGNQKTRTEWHRVVLYGDKHAAIIKAAQKGSKIYLEGSLRTRKYTDKKEIQRSVTEVVLQPNKGYINIVLNATRSAEEGENVEQHQQQQQDTPQESQ